jgi:hypothetical protein
MVALFVVLMGVFAAQGRAVIALRPAWCDDSVCGCAATSSNGQHLDHWTCVCDSTGAYRICYYS